jgi:hypothetical protein
VSEALTVLSASVIHGGRCSRDVGGVSQSRPTGFQALNVLLDEPLAGIVSADMTSGAHQRGVDAATVPG